MGIISFDKEALIDYIPAYGGNRESENPSVARIKYIPYSRVQHYSRLIAAKAKGVNESARISEIAHEVQKKQFCENLESLSNYVVNGKETTANAETVYETADTELIMELIRAMESASKLSEGQRKN